MGNQNILPSNRAAFAGVIDPDAYAPAAISTGWVSMVTFKNIMAVVMAGDFGTAGTINAKLEQAQDSGGTGVKDITGKAITALTQAGSDSNKQAIINCRDDELDINNDFTHVRLTVTVGDTTSPVTATSDMAAFIIGMDPKFGPADDLASVDEVVS